MRKVISKVSAVVAEQGTPGKGAWFTTPYGVRKGSVSISLCHTVREVKDTLVASSGLYTIKVAKLSDVPAYWSRTATGPEQYSCPSERELNNYVKWINYVTRTRPDLVTRSARLNSQRAADSVFDAYLPLRLDEVKKERMWIFRYFRVLSVVPCLGDLGTVLVLGALPLLRSLSKFGKVLKRSTHTDRWYYIVRNGIEPEEGETCHFGHEELREIGSIFTRVCCMHNPGSLGQARLATTEQRKLCSGLEPHTVSRLVRNLARAIRQTRRGPLMTNDFLKIASLARVHPGLVVSLINAGVLAIGRLSSVGGCYIAPSSRRGKVKMEFAPIEANLLVDYAFFACEAGQVYSTCSRPVWVVATDSMAHISWQEPETVAGTEPLPHVLGEGLV